MSERSFARSLKWGFFDSLPRLVLQGLLLSLVILPGCSGRTGAVGVTPETPSVATYRSPAASAMYHFMRGRLLAEDGDPAQAVEELRRAIEFDPDSTYLRLSLARLLLLIGDDQSALDTAEQALLQKPDQLEVHLLLGGIYFRDRNYRAATRHFNKVVELEPSHENAYLHLTVAYGRLGELDAALQAIQGLLQNNPASLAGQLTLGRLYRELDLPAESESVYRRLFASQPGLVSAYLELGALLEQQQRLDEALEVYRLGLQKNGRNLLLRRRLIRLLVQTEQLDEALEELRVVVQLNPDDRESQRKIGLILLEQGAWADAEAVFSGLLESEPTAEQTLFYYATALERQQQWQAALEVMVRIGPQSKLYPDALYHQSFLHYQLGHYEQAIELMRQRLKHPPQRVDFYDFLASLQEVAADIPAARATLEEGVARFPDNAEIRYHLGLVLEKSGERETAMATMEEVLLRDPEHVEALNYVAYNLAEQSKDLDRALRLVNLALAQKSAAHILDTLGWIHYQAGRYAEARVALEQAAAEISSDPVIWQHLGDTYRALGLEADAVQAYRHALEFDPDNPDLHQRLKLLEGEP